jgi:DNA-binding transcriptional regulator YdaS (Cro superfamily)
MSPSQALELAAAVVGSKGLLCEKLGVSRQAIAAWRKRQIPLKRALQIIDLSNGAVTLSDLRPDFEGVNIVAIENA